MSLLDNQVGNIVINLLISGIPGIPLPVPPPGESSSGGSAIKLATLRETERPLSNNIVYRHVSLL